MTWNDRLDDESWGVVQWLESFETRSQLRKEWVHAPKLSSSHALVELLENDPPCVVRAERWITGDERFPIRALREHDNCVDPEVAPVTFHGDVRTYTEIIYSEGSTHGIH